MGLAAKGSDDDRADVDGGISLDLAGIVGGGQGVGGSRARADGDATIGIQVGADTRSDGDARWRR